MAEPRTARPRSRNRTRDRDEANSKEAPAQPKKETTAKNEKSNPANRPPKDTPGAPVNRRPAGRQSTPRARAPQQPTGESVNPNLTEQASVRPRGGRPPASGEEAGPPARPSNPRGRPSGRTHQPGSGNGNGNGNGQHRPAAAGPSQQPTGGHRDPYPGQRSGPRPAGASQPSKSAARSSRLSPHLGSEMNQQRPRSNYPANPGNPANQDRPRDHRPGYGPSQRPSQRPDNRTGGHPADRPFRAYYRNGVQPLEPPEPDTEMVSPIPTKSATAPAEAPAQATKPVRAGAPRPTPRMTQVPNTLPMELAREAEDCWNAGMTLGQIVEWIEEAGYDIDVEGVQRALRSLGPMRDRR